MSFPHDQAMAPRGDFPHRTPKPLPFELVQHTGYFLEEGLYTLAFDLLFNTLASGTYASNKVLTPLPQHLALAATILVHPSTTTRAQSTEEKSAPDVALRLLRLFSAQINPIEAKLNTAFSFSRSKLSRSGRRFHEEHDPTGDLSHDETMPLNLPLGQAESLWSRADDFWHAVGWAFNCSVLYPKRWDRWQIWLQFMCEVLVDDWSQREKEYIAKQEQSRESSQNAASGTASRGTLYQGDDLNILRQSLVFQYISAGARNINTRRILKSIFADGSTASINLFKEVFEKETALFNHHKDSAKAKKREREVNIDKDQYGDYFTDGSDDDSVSGPSKSQSRSSTPLEDLTNVRRTKRTRRGTRNASDPTGEESAQEASDAQGQLTHHGGGVSQLGGLESLALRKKLLGILSRVSDYMPKDFIQLNDLYQFFVENIRHQPLPIFQAFVNPLVRPELDDEAQTTLCEYLLFNMIEAAARESQEDRLTAAKLEHCFLPYAAATPSAVDNAKFSILLESLVSLLAGRGWIKQTPSLRAAVSKGIRHREDRAKEEPHRGHAGRTKEGFEWDWLKESGERLTFLVDLLPVE